MHPTSDSNPKSPKTSRCVNTSMPGESSSTVPFQTTTASQAAQTAASLINPTSGSSENKASPSTASSSGGQPTSYPALVPPAGLAPGQWYTSRNPAQSVSSPAGFPGNPQLLQHPQTQLHPHQFGSVSFSSEHPNVGYIRPTNMAGYPTGFPPGAQSFQPPVPDTTNGPMVHLYVPRHDGGISGVTLPPGTQNPPVRLPNALHQNAPYIPSAQQNAASMYPHLLAQMQPNNPPYYQGQPNWPGAQPQQQQGYVAQPQPVYQAPLMFNNGGQFQTGTAAQFAPAPPPIGAYAGQPPYVAGNAGPPNDILGLGRTAGEETIRMLNVAYGNKCFEPQDFKPSDDDPSRFYYCRELDGNWTQRTRFTIDHMGDWRWYVTDEGWFYAVRLPN